MRLIKQHTSIKVRNIDFSHNNERRHGPLLPNTIRSLIVGPSNCGKTNVMLSLIESPNGLRFKNIYLYSKTYNQEKYVLLKKIKDANIFIFSDADNVIKPNLTKKKIL